MVVGVIAWVKVGGESGSVGVAALVDSVQEGRQRHVISAKLLLHSTCTYKSP